MNAANRKPPPSQFIDGCETGSSTDCATSNSPNSSGTSATTGDAKPMRGCEPATSKTTPAPISRYKASAVGCQRRTSESDKYG